VTSPSSISPRHAPVSSPSDITNQRKFLRSNRARRPCARHKFPVFSNKPLGWYSSSRSTRVRFGASSWKVTTPLTLPLSPSEVHAIFSSGICSLISAFHDLVENATLAFHVVVASSFCVTLCTPLVNRPNSWNCVHWL